MKVYRKLRTSGRSFLELRAFALVVYLIAVHISASVFPALGGGQVSATSFDMISS